MTIRCYHHKQAHDYGCYNFHCIPFDKRLDKKENGEKGDHPCPFRDFSECQEWMEGEKIQILWQVWLKKYDPGGLHSADFLKWLRHIGKISPEYVWDFKRKYLDSLDFVGYEKNGCTQQEQLQHKLELLKFRPKDPYPTDKEHDCCINDPCGEFCKNYIVCPIVHNKKELLAIGVPAGLKKTSSYHRWKYHLSKAKELGDIHKAKTIWYILRELAVGDLCSPEIMSKRGTHDESGEKKLEIIVEI